MTPQIFKDYQELAMRTCKEMGSRKLNIAHMIIGLTSEMHELDDAIDKQDNVNISEEIADMYWYLAGICTLYGLELSNAIAERDEHGEVTIDRAISLLNQTIKWDIIYSNYPIDHIGFAGTTKELRELVENGVQQVVDAITGLEAWCDISLEKALTNNINKLKARHGDKYSDLAATVRDLDVEREMLEG